jgi:hypothetical protein
VQEVDEVGVVLSRQRDGRFKAFTVGYRVGVEVYRTEVSRDRSFVRATRDAVEAVDSLVTAFSRGGLSFREQAPLTVKVD